MIDTHAHLDFSQFDQDREEVIARFFSQNGKAIVNVGVDLECSERSIEIAEQHEKFYASVGLHPDFFSKIRPSNQSPAFPFRPDATSERNSSKPDFWSNPFEELKELAKHEKVVAIGECGLDYYHLPEFKKPGFSRGNPVFLEKIKKRQKEGFLAQIEIARELELPVIVHCRNASVADTADSGGDGGQKSAWEDLYDIISRFSKNPTYELKSKFAINPKAKLFPSAPFEGRNSSKLSFGLTKFVLHCYSGKKDDTEKFLKLPNVSFSFSGNITYPKPEARAKMLAEAVKMIPLDKIMLDSDAPFLAPQELRGERNEPINVIYIAKKITEIKGVSAEEAERTTDKNAKNFFDFSTYCEKARKY